MCVVCLCTLSINTHTDKYTITLVMCFIHSIPAHLEGCVCVCVSITTKHSDGAKNMLNFL